MRPDGVVMPTPSLDQHLSFLERVEDLAVEQLVSELAIEGLIEAVLPRAAGLDKEGLDLDPGKPGSNDLGRELRAIV